MSTPKRFTEAIHIGTAEFSFCKDAKTRAETRPPNGFRDVGNVDVYQLQIENETFQREGAYRGKKSVDASFSIKQSIGYMIRCDELTKDNLLMLAMGKDLGDNARGALTAAAGDVMPFTANTPSDSRLWYDLTVASEQVTSVTALFMGGAPVAFTTSDTGDTINKAGHGLQNGDRVMLVTLVTTTGASVLTPYYVVGAATDTFQIATTAGGSALTLTTDGSGTYVAGFVEDVDYELDEEVGRVRFLVPQTASVYPFITAPAITNADDTYAKSITPLEESSFEGYARLLIFNAQDETLTWDHRDFSCSITPSNNQESTGKTPSMFDFIVKITHDRGRIFAGKRTLND